MSDFFTRLAERTLGLALTIQPIKPSLFAPEPDYDGEALLELAEESSAAQTFADALPVAEIPTLPPDSDRMAAQEHAVETSVARSVYAPAAQPLPAATPERQALDSLSVATPSNTMHTTRPQSNVKQQQLTRYTHRRAPVTEPRSANAAQVREVTPGAVLPYPLTDQEHNNDADLFKSPSLLKSYNDAAKRSAMSDSNTGLDGGNTSERYMEATTRVETSTHEHTIAHHTILGERSGRNTQSSISAPAARTQPAPPEPTIQVTIGRVEVRAVTAPTTTTRPQQQPARATAMSLDEYLRRQEQGGRK